MHVCLLIFVETGMANENLRGVRARWPNVGAAIGTRPCDHYIHSSQPTPIHPGRPASVIQRQAVYVYLSLGANVELFVAASHHDSHQFFTNQH